MAKKTKLYNNIYRAVKSCFAMENTESWTTRALGHWNKAKKEANDDLEKLKVHVGILIKNINAEDSRRKAGLFKYFAKAAAKSSESTGANPNHSADDGGSDDIEITSSTAGPSAGPQLRQLIKLRHRHKINLNQKHLLSSSRSRLQLKIK